MKPARAPDPRNRLIQQIHVAKRQLGLLEADYRALLAGATGGKASCSEMSIAELGAVIEALVKSGFKAGFKGNAKHSDRKVIRLIFGLWMELGKRGLIENATKPALRAFVERMTRPPGGTDGSGIGDPEWLDNTAANKVVEALKAIRDRGKKGAA